MKKDFTVPVAIDDTPQGYAAAGLVGDWFGSDCRILALHVGHLHETAGESPPVGGGLVEYPVAPIHEYRMTVDTDPHTAREVAERAARIAGGKAMVREGDVVDAITPAATDISVDLVVLGTHEHSVLSRFFGHSTTEGVVTKAPCPVLVTSGVQLT